MLAETTWPEVAHYAVSCGLVAWFAGIGLLTAVLYVVIVVLQNAGKEWTAREKAAKEAKHD